MRWLLVFLLAVAPLSAHPLDDKADMQAQLRVADDIELRLEFRYRDVVASYTEFRNGLDRDLDGQVTREEVKRRFNELAPEVAFGIGLSLDGQPLNIDPDFDRFEFKDLDNPAADLQSGIDTSTARILYVFVYRAAPELQPGEHKIEFFFNGAQTVVHTPKQQLRAIDAQGNPLPTEYDLALHAFPRLTATFSVDQPPSGAPYTTPPETQPATGAPQRAELPNWAVVAIGAAMALLGIGLGIRRLVYRKGSAATAALLVLAGVAIACGALLRSGMIAAA